jgi:ATPase family AAA domain-containing protein 3A/B
MVRHERSAKVARHFDSQHQAKESCALPSRLLLYAPPGFGKTMFVRGLANQLGVEYTIMNGGDIAPLERDAITELHKLFDWAKTSRRGLLLFVDEKPMPYSKAVNLQKYPKIRGMA